MASRMKEEEKNERIIRGLLKLPANRRCINCNNLGPQYVCTNFWTFICTNCSGAHREFTHRVKSVSMAKFTSQEVAALQEGGNERARALYFKEWDPQRHSYPDSSNSDRLREFIRHVYVDRRYASEKNVDRGQRLKGDREDSNENRRADSDRSGSRSPPYEDRYGDRTSSVSRSDSRYSYGDRSPVYDQRSPGRFEPADDRRRDDKSGNGSQNRRLEEQKVSDGPKPDMRSPDRPKNISIQSPPVVRPVRDILGDNAPRLQVGEPAKINGIKPPENPALTKRISSSSSIGSSDGNNAQLKTFSSGSLIDFSAEPETATSVTPQQPLPQQPTAAPAAPAAPANGGDWASFDVVDKQQVPPVAAAANPLESVLAELAAPAVNTPGLTSMGIDSSFNAPGNGQAPAMPQPQPQPQPLMFSAADSINQPPTMPISGAPNDQSWTQPPASHMQRPTAAPYVAPGSNLPKINTRPPLQVPPPPEQPPSSGRKELPVDLFTLYQQAPMHVQGWQRGPYPGVAYGMNYPPAPMPMPVFPQPPKAANPFDNEPASTFPSMSPLQGALPNMSAPTTPQQNQGFGGPSPRWIPPQQFSYPTASPAPFMMQQQQQYPGAMFQQPPNHMMLMGHQGVGRPITDGATFGHPGMDPVARYSLPSTPNSSGSGGNPFG